MSCTAYILMNGVLTPNEGLSIGSQVTLTNQDDTGVVTWAWTIVSKPTGSTTTLTGASSATAYFTPDVEGAYLVRLIVNKDLATEEQGTSVGRVKTLHKNLLPHAKDETSEGHPVEGWAKAWRESYLKVDKALGIPSDRRTVKYSDSATTGPVFLAADGTMYTMANGDVVPSVRLATAADDKQAMFLFESGALAPGVVTVLAHGMSASVPLTGVSAGDKLYASTNGSVVNSSLSYLHRALGYCIYVSSGVARVWFAPTDHTLLSTINHEQLQGLLGGAVSAHYHLNLNQHNAVNGANSPSSSNVFATINDLSGHVPATRKVEGTDGLTGGGALTTDLQISMPNVGSADTYGTASKVPRLTTDAKGRVSGVVETDISIAQSQVSGLVADLAAKANKTITVSAGGALSGGGDLTTNRTISLNTIHSGFSATGGSTTIPIITVDSYGRVTNLTGQSITYGTGTLQSITFDVSNTGLTINGNASNATVNGSSGTFTLAGVLQADNGGTGLSTYAQGTMLYAGSVNPTALTPLPLTASKVLLSGASAPSWGSLPLNNSSYVTGTLAVGNGGTGLTSYAIGDIVYASAAGTLAGLPTGTVGQLLIGQGAATAPAWKTVTSSGDVTGLTAAGAFTVGKINGATVPAAGSLTTGHVLQVNGASALTYGAINLGGGTNYVTGILPIARGGTGTSTAPTATQVLLGKSDGTYELRTFAPGTNTTVDTTTPNQIKINASFTAPVTSVSGTANQINPSSATTGAVVLSLADTTVSPGTYGDGGYVPQIQIDSKGRITSAQSVAIDFPSISQINYGAMRNYVINGAFDYWQRGTYHTITMSSTSQPRYTADRWCAYVNTDASATFTIDKWYGLTDDSQTGCLRYYRLNNGLQNAAQIRSIGHNVEQELLNQLRGRKLRLSFYYKMSSSFISSVSKASTLTDNILVRIVHTNSPANRNRAFKAYYSSPATNTNFILNRSIKPASSGVTADTWVRFDYVSQDVLPADTTAAAVVVSFEHGDTANASEFFYLTNFMLLDAGTTGSYGSVDIPFLYSSGTLANELVACQRYYEKSWEIDEAPGTVTFAGMEIGYNNSSGTLVANTPWRFTPHPKFKVRKRSAPSSVTLYGFTDTNAAGVQPSILQSGYWQVGAGADSDGTYVYPTSGGAAHKASFATSITDSGFMVASVSAIGSGTGYSFGHWTADAEYY